MLPLASDRLRPAVLPEARNSNVTQTARWPVTRLTTSGLSTAIMTPVATASLAEAHTGHPTVNRPNMVQVGTIVWLASELMFFAGLFAVYFTIRAVQPGLWETEPEKLNIPFSLA